MEIKTAATIIDEVYSLNNGGKDVITSTSHGETMSAIRFKILAGQVAKKVAAQAVKLALEEAGTHVDFSSAYPTNDSILSLEQSVIDKLK